MSAQKTSLINFRITDEEHDIFARNCEAAGIKQSDILRAVVFLVNDYGMDFLYSTKSGPTLKDMITLPGR